MSPRFFCFSAFFCFIHWPRSNRSTQKLHQTFWDKWIQSIKLLIIAFPMRCICVLSGNASMKYILSPYSVSKEGVSIAECVGWILLLMLYRQFYPSSLLFLVEKGFSALIVNVKLREYDVLNWISSCETLDNNKNALQKWHYRRWSQTIVSPFTHWTKSLDKYILHISDLHLNAWLRVEIWKGICTPHNSSWAQLRRIGWSCRNGSNETF